MSHAVVEPEERFNFAAHLLSRNADRREKIAYLDDEGALSYGALEPSVRALAGALGGLGLRREERVLLFMHDTTDWPVVFLGCLFAGVVPVAVNTLLAADDLAHMIADSRAQAAFVSGALVPALRAAMAKSAHEIRHVVVSRAGASAGDERALGELVAAGDLRRDPAPTSRDEPAFWLYSSGSTGRPKGTVHTHANLYWTAELYGRPVLGLRESDVCFSAAKLFFAYGLGNSLTFPLSVGASVVLMAERPTPEATFRRWVEKRPTVFFGAPTGYAGMLASPSLPSADQVALRLCSSAGEALPREIGERFTARFGCEIVDGLGSTEMLHIFLSNRPGSVCYGTTGEPVPGYEVELRDEAGQRVEGAGRVGDLFVKGPSAALMYWCNRDKSRDTFRGAWTKCGDKYSRDEQGRYIYAGRGDDMLKVSGQYVSPFEVESTLLEHPRVLEAAVIGVVDEHGLTRVKAFVVLRDSVSHEGLGDELRALVKSRLAPHKAPRLFEVLVELPKTATGKIQRFRLRDRERGSER